MHRAIVKPYGPRPFVPDDSLRQSVLAQHLGYNEHNSTEINWGIEPGDDAQLKDFLGDNFFKEVNLKRETCMVRLLRYDPGHCIPMHTDSYNGFKDRFGDGDVKRFFVAVSPWDWGHFLQIHDNMIHHWKPGYTIEVPVGVFHLSGMGWPLPRAEHPAASPTKPRAGPHGAPRPHRVSRQASKYSQPGGSLE